MQEKIDGITISSKNAPIDVRKAYKSWCDQRQRCSNPKDPRYKWWGAKGIKVEYSAFEFVQWWLQEARLKGPFKRPNCSRIDHEKNYSLNNIMLLECAENSKERMDRIGAPVDGIFITAVQLHSGKVTMFKSAYEASCQTGVAKSNILHMIENGPTRTIRTGWVFFKTPKSN